MKRKTTVFDISVLGGWTLLACLLTGCPDSSTISGGGGIKPAPIGDPKLIIQGQNVQWASGSDTSKVELGLARIAVLDLSQPGKASLRDGKYVFSRQWDRLSKSGRLLTMRSSRFTAGLNLKTRQLTTPANAILIPRNGTSGTLQSKESQFDLKDITFLAIAQNGNETAMMSCCAEPCKPIDIPTAIANMQNADAAPPDIMWACVPRPATDGNETVIILECNIIDPRLDGNMEQIFPGIGSLVYPNDAVAASRAMPASFILPWPQIAKTQLDGPGVKPKDPTQPGQKSANPTAPAAKSAAEIWDYTCRLSTREYQATICDNILTITLRRDGSTTEIDMAGCKVGLSQSSDYITIRYNEACAAKMSSLPCRRP